MTTLFRPSYRRYVLACLTLVFTLNNLDGSLIVLLVQPIKSDLALSDTELGFVTGIAFSLFYAALGVPMARWSDSGNRVTIVSVSIGLWGLAMMLSLLVTDFSQLVLTRIIAAVGEAGCMSSTYSLVGDYYSESAERPRAMSIYLLAGPLASLISLISGGWLSETHGWRMALFALGVPAIPAALLVKLTVAEPRTEVRATSSRASMKLPSIYVVLETLWKQKSLRHLTIALVLLYSTAGGLGPWYAAFLMRSHGMQVGELGVAMGLIFGLGGVVGILFGGHAATRWFADNERAQMSLSAIMTACIVPCFALFLLLPSKAMSLTALVPQVVLFSVFFGPTFSLLQRLVVDEMRATTFAVVMFLANLVGTGIGPQVVGIVSDLLRGAFGPESLRYSMLMMSMAALLSAYYFWAAGRTILRDLESVATQESAVGAYKTMVPSHAGQS